MRSFIKKLAGAMALTMVVSSVAPAGAVFADSEGYLALQGGDTRVEDDFTIALRSNPANQTPVDLRFVGAPDEWKNGVVWSSSNEDVATVDKNGNVTAKAEGETKITVRLKEGRWEASAWINVVSTANNGVEGVFIAAQNTLSPLASIEVSNKEGKEGVDLWYLNGAGEAQWVSSDETIATVTPNGGLVKGVVGANGIATVSLLLDGEVAASVEVIVGTPVVNEFVEGDASAVVYSITEEGEVEVQGALDAAEFVVGDEATIAVDYEAYVVDNNGTVVEDYSGLYAFDWTSSDEEVVKVVDGVLTAVGVGEATLTAFGMVVDGYEVEVVANVTVAKAALDANYTVTQLSDKKIQLTFADAEAAKAAKVTNLVKVLSTGEITWIIDGTPAVKDNTVTITTFAAFANGGEYKVYVTVEETENAVDFTTEYGVVDTIEVTYKSKENGTVLPLQEEAGKAYANAEDEDSIVVELSAKLFSNGVDVTTAEGNDVADVSYTLETESEYVELVEEDGVYYLVFTKAGETAKVVAEYPIVNAAGEADSAWNGEEGTIIVSEEAPVYKIETVAAWSLVYADGKLDWSAPKHTVPAGETGIKVVALVKDSYGNYYVTDEAFKGVKYNGTAVKYIGDEETKFEAEDYSISMEVSDKTAMRIKAEDDGAVELVTYKPAKGSILFTLYKDEKKVSDFYAVNVTVETKKEFNTIKLSSDSITLPMTGNYTTGKITIALEDQYEGAWTKEEAVVITAEKKYADKLKENDYIVGTYKTNKDGKVEIDVDGAKFKEIFAKDGDTKTTEVKFTVTVGKKTATFKVEAKKLTGTAKLALKVAGTVDQAKLNNENVPVVKTAITLDKTQGGFKVAEEKLTYIASSGALDAVKAATNGALVLEGVKVEKGAKFLIVEDPNGNYVAEKATSAAVGAVEATKNNAFVMNNNGTYELVVANAEKVSAATDAALVMDYAVAGTYKVKVYEVTDFAKDGTAVLKEKYTEECVVNNSRAAAAVDKQKAEVVEVGDLTTAGIIAEAIAFKNAGTITADNIVAYNVIGGEEEGFLIIIDVTLRVKVNDKCGAFYDVFVEVDKSIDLK